MATKKMAKSGKPSGNLPGLDKLRKFEANPANKAEVAKRSEMAGKMVADMKARQSADSGKVQSQRDSAAKAQQAKQSAMADRMKAAPKPAMPARPMGGGMGSMAGRGGMGSMAGRGGMGSRPAMTPQVKQGLLDMSNKLRAMPMKKGGRAKK